MLIAHHPDEFDGVHRGDRRGRRLQHHRARPADVPDRGRREGHGLDAAHRPRQGRTRLDDNRDNAVTELATAVARIGAHHWPVRLTPTMEALLATVAELAGIEATPEDAEALVGELGSATRMLGAGSATPRTRRC